MKSGTLDRKIGPEETIMIRSVFTLCLLVLASVAVGYSARDHFGWNERDVRIAYQCGKERAYQIFNGKPSPGVTDLDKDCMESEHAGWTKKDYQIAACFAIYNDRPHDANGMLPYDQEARDRSDDCFKKLKTVAR